jgi:long-subunit fatty acid transport protein
VRVIASPSARFVPSATLALLLALTGSALGGGMEVGDSGGEAMGRGGAFVAKADSPATLNYNPAGFAKLRGYQATISANVVYSTVDFQRLGRFSFGKEDATGTPYPTVQNSRPLFAAPMHFVLTSDFGLRKLTFAAGMYVPAAVPTAYPLSTNINGRDVAAPQRYMLATSDSDSQLLLFPSVAVGWHLHEKIDIGLSFQWAMYKIAYTQVSTVGAACETPEDPSCDITVNLDVSSWFAPTGSAGVLVRPFSGLELGGMVRFPSHAEMKGKAKASFGPGVSKLNPYVQKPLLDPMDPSVTVTNDYPWMFRLGARYVFYSGDEEKADIEADFVYERWSGASIRTVTLDAQSLGKPLAPVIMDQKFRDTFAVRLGGSYRFRLTSSVDLTLRAGLFVETETNDISDTNLSVIGQRRVGLTGGVGLRWGWLKADVAYAHLFLPERVVERSSFTASDFGGSGTAGPVVGNGIYNARVDALYLQITAAYGATPVRPRRAEAEPPAADQAPGGPVLDELGFEVQEGKGKAAKGKSAQRGLVFEPETVTQSELVFAPLPVERTTASRGGSTRVKRAASSAIRRSKGQRTQRRLGAATPTRSARAVKSKTGSRTRRPVAVQRQDRCRERAADGRCVRLALRMR